jgi:hypothetical protein
MTPGLSDEQRQAVRERPGAPVHVVDAATRSSYVLLPQVAYEQVRALFEADDIDPAELAPLADEVAAREGWDDPAMDVYDALDPRRENP